MQRFLILWASLWLGLWISAGLNAQSVHISHCLLQCPDVSSIQNEVVVRHLYAAAIDSERGVAEWVAYRVLGDTVGVASLLPRWWQEEALSETARGMDADVNVTGFEQPDLSDAQDREYRQTEFTLTTDDRGRLAPMTSFAGTPYWDELNNLSNMSPLPYSLRLGSWSRLDMAINEVAALAGELHVVSGPIYSYSQSATTDELLQSPSSYFKVITDGESVAAFVFDSELPPHRHHCDQVSSLEAIESQLDRQLLPALQNLREADWFKQFGCDR